MADDDTILPVTEAQVRKAIRSPGAAAYLYLGSGNAAGWRHAQRIDADPGFPKLRVYRVADVDAVATWAAGATEGGLVITDRGATATHIPIERTESLIEVILAIAEILGDKA
jgi:hypothetical protein